MSGDGLTVLNICLLVMIALGVLVAVVLELYSVFADKSGQCADNRRQFEEPKSALYFLWIGGYG
ncbi:hypothetical protein [Ehrlichia canis]|uniref:Uncharacterized protein n=1 Tax=Ehrlichia canis (strain Jake) TaxID=269484 RepID=A0ACA6AWN5_EHRCJ|nr:hypothetical protein [Ehrlichia canis]AAZ68800.1 hypothetical protein Ecaj_0769 [Ehrlichia canis str. Jake]